MSFTDDENTVGEDTGGTPEPASSQELAQTLDEIMCLLRRMIALAELSVSDLNVDRQLLQRTFERLRDEVDRLADGIDL